MLTKYCLPRIEQAVQCSAKYTLSAKYCTITLFAIYFKYFICMFVVLSYILKTAHFRVGLDFRELSFSTMWSP